MTVQPEHTRSLWAEPTLHDATQDFVIVLAVLLIVLITWFILRLILRRRSRASEVHAPAEAPSGEEPPPVAMAPEAGPARRKRVGQDLRFPSRARYKLRRFQVGRSPRTAQLPHAPPRGLPGRGEGDEYRMEKVEAPLEIEPTKSPPSPPASAEDAPAPRYADFAIFHRDGAGRDRSVPDGHTLQSQHAYILEVAVRQKPVGIPVVDPSRRPIQESRSKAEVDIWVTLDVEADFLEVEEPVQTLRLPPVGDSLNNAKFFVRPLRPSTGPNDLVDIRVRLFYKFNLIEVCMIRAEVTEQFGDPSRSRFGLETPISFVQERLERELVDVDDIWPRAIHIDVTKARAGYDFRFTFSNAAEKEVVFSAPVRLTREELEDTLVTLRKILYDIALGEPFLQQLDRGEKNALLRKLAEAGRRMWIMLFRRERGTAIFEVGRWLQAHPPARDSLVQISVATDAADIVFPWALLYDQKLSDETYELVNRDGFWGLRYVIEQKLPSGCRKPDAPIKVDDRLDLFFALWPFGNSDKQKALVRDLVGRSGGRLVATAPVTDADTCRRQLMDCQSQILYFYSHGHMRHRLADIGSGSGLSEFVKWYERLPLDSPTRKDCRPLYEKVQREDFEPEKSWIALEHGKLYLDAMYEQIDAFNPKSPLVVLNMCESAQMFPSLKESFVHFFLSRGAIAVLGTECPMTVEFAHPFSVQFLEATLSGDPLGAALLKARRRFMNDLNPLGLAYSLYGDATASFQPPVIHPPSPASPISSSGERRSSDR